MLAYLRKHFYIVCRVGRHLGTDGAYDRHRNRSPKLFSFALRPVQATIAVTVRLDERRYERMKGWGINRRVTNQEVIIAAFDRFFRLNDGEREEAISGVRKKGRAYVSRYPESVIRSLTYVSTSTPFAASVVIWGLMAPATGAS